MPAIIIMNIAIIPRRNFPEGTNRKKRVNLFHIKHYKNMHQITFNWIYKTLRSDKVQRWAEWRTQLENYKWPINVPLSIWSGPGALFLLAAESLGSIAQSCEFERQYLGWPSGGQESLSQRAEMELRSTPSLHHFDEMASSPLTMSTMTRAMPVSGWHSDLWFEPLQHGTSEDSFTNARHSTRVGPPDVAMGSSSNSVYNLAINMAWEIRLLDKMPPSRVNTD